VIYAGREAGMNFWKEKYAQKTEARTLGDIIKGADIFMGLSGPGVLTQEHVMSMADQPLILAMSNPVPEIMPELAKEVRPDAILATGRSDYPNQVNNVLCFPFIFRGALDCGATTINDEMKAACVEALASLARKEATDVVNEAYAGEELRFGPEYLIPKPFDPRLIEEVPVAVVAAAMKSGVATRPIEDLEAYRKKLHEFVNRTGLFMQPFIDIARRNPEKIVYPEGENRDILLAVQAVVDEGVAHPILLGQPDVIRERIDQFGLRLVPGEDIEVINPAEADHDKRYSQFYHKLVGRSGVTVEGAQNLVRSNSTVLAAVMVAIGDANGLICGKVGRFESHFRDIHDVLGANKYISSLCPLLLPNGPLFIADSFLNVDPTVDEIVATTRASIDLVRHFGIKPKVALLSHSNFGTSKAESAVKMHKAAEILRRELPKVEIDGEMHSYSALNEALRNTVFPDANLTGRANLLIMPNLDTANIALGLIRSLTDALLIGPLLSGLRKPAHIVIPSVTSRGIFNMTAFTVAEIHRRADSSNG
ncbi:MAG: NADP-dependent malic enzyme, partial [Gammaproteobacteria bacterium]|nr:NADP-dependent malic enzyme [Gammaproteobacteria bacterium]